MKLKFELVNGYGVLVDEEEEIIAGDLILWNGKVKTAIDTEYIHPSHKIIFAEPELNLDGVPVFEWRDFEVWQKSKEVKHWGQFASTAFVKGYKSNPAKYTEEDLRKAISMARDYSADVVGYQKDEIIQSLQKYPKYVVMESDDWEEYGERYKLFTNSEGKQQGTVKQLIWE